MLNMINHLSISVTSAWGNGVDKSGKSVAQTFKLITHSTCSPLDISQTIALMRFLNAGYAQLVRFFTQSKMSHFNLVGGQFYSFSAGPINTNKLIKDF